jgi:acyl-coenzyme A thioesterase PaaI-like protein
VRNTFDKISAGEYAELYDRYTPLTAAVRDLVDVSLRTGVDAGTIADATTAIEAVTDMLRCEQADRPVRFQRHEITGRPVVWSNPVIGLRNPLAPPLTVHHDSDGRCWSEFTLGSVYEGPPGLVHGGISAMILDQLLGEVATDELTTPKFTGTITVRYLRGTPLGPLRAEAVIDRSENHKTYARGFISDAQGPTVEAEGVFIMPMWAREQEPK